MQINLKNKYLRYSSAVGTTFAVIWLGFWDYCYRTAPRAIDVDHNKVYEVNFHGTSLFLNSFEYFTLYAIPATALLVGIITALIAKFKS